MRKKKSHAQKPMLYIEQPKLGKPSASMQSSYRTPKKKKDKKSDVAGALDRQKKVKKKIPKSKPVEKEEKDVVYSDKEDVIAELEEEVKEEEKLELKEEVKEEEKLESEEREHKESGEEDETIRPRTARKRFGEMTVEEKVDYFVGLPAQVPKMRCEVRTRSERHLGVVTDYQDGFVHMTTVRRPKNKQIDINEIENIRLLSF